MRYITISCGAYMCGEITCYLPTREYGLAKSFYEMIEPYVDFYIIDEREKVIAEFREKYPQFANHEIIIDLMH